MTDIRNQLDACRQQLKAAEARVRNEADELGRAADTLQALAQKHTPSAPAPITPAAVAMRIIRFGPPYACVLSPSPDSVFTRLQSAGVPSATAFLRRLFRHRTGRLGRSTGDMHTFSPRRPVPIYSNRNAGKQRHEVRRGTYPRSYSVLRTRSWCCSYQICGLRRRLERLEFCPVFPSQY
ncbi:hypothetical protein C8R43DRAFT_1039969 [Mycena crocata]|nr:hypothetical protein C8R43DRAFT_1039969 [Mycena crocata]